MTKEINITMTPKLEKALEHGVRAGGYKNKNAFLRAIFRAWEEHQVLLSVKQSEKEFAQGKGKTLKSLKDL